MQITFFNGFKTSWSAFFFFLLSVACLLFIVLPVADVRRDWGAGVFQARGIKWCVWGVEIVLCARGRYLVRAAALCGDLINRSRLHLLSLAWSADPGGQINSCCWLLSQLKPLELKSLKICFWCIHLIHFYSFIHFHLFLNTLIVASLSQHAH